jgi:hypothetical protein
VVSKDKLLSAIKSDGLGWCSVIFGWVWGFFFVLMITIDDPVLVQLLTWLLLFPMKIGYTWSDLRPRTEDLEQPERISRFDSPSGSGLEPLCAMGAERSQLHRWLRHPILPDRLLRSQ